MSFAFLFIKYEKDMKILEDYIKFYKFVDYFFQFSELLI